MKTLTEADRNMRKCEVTKMTLADIKSQIRESGMSACRLLWLKFETVEIKLNYSRTKGTMEGFPCDGMV